MINNPTVVSSGTVTSFDKCKNNDLELVADTAIEVLDENQERTYATFVNNSKVDITLVLGSHASARLNKGIILKPGGSFEITSINLYTGKVSAIAATVARLSYVECQE